MQALEGGDVVAFPGGLGMQLTLSEQGRKRCRRELEGSVGKAGVLAPALGCLNPRQAELLCGHRHRQLHLMCGNYLAPCGCSFPLIFGGIDL